MTLLNLCLLERLKVASKELKAKFLPSEPPTQSLIYHSRRLTFLFIFICIFLFHLSQTNFTVFPLHRGKTIQRQFFQIIRIDIGQQQIKPTKAAYINSLTQPYNSVYFVDTFTDTIRKAQKNLNEKKKENLFMTTTHGNLSTRIICKTRLFCNIT